MKVNRPLVKITSILLIKGLLLCLPLSCLAQAGMAPISPHYQKYLEDITGVHSQGTSKHNYGAIPSPHDFSYLKGKRLAKVSAMSSLPSSYDLRDYDRVTSVKNQGSCGSCWAFGSMGSVESCLLPGEVRDFSENNLKNMHGFDLSCCAGGFLDFATAYFLRWDGPVNESDDPYRTYCGSGSYEAQKHIQEVIYIPPRAYSLDNDSIKQAIIAYGAVAVNLYMTEDEQYYNPTTAALYVDEDDVYTNHIICIVGWDDCYSKENFSASNRPEGDGAFIVKNSWGSSWGKQGYFYVSYYDKTFGRQDASAVYLTTSADYAEIYQYDPLGWVGSYNPSYPSTSETGYFANVFTATDSLPLEAVGWYTAEPDSTYELDIYIDPDSGPISSSGSVLHQTGTIDNVGYKTVALDSSVPLTVGHKFSVVVKLTTPDFSYPVPCEAPFWYASRATANAGESYISGDGKTWQDFADEFEDCNVCIKAYAGNPAYVPPTLLITSPTTESTYCTTQTTIDICGIASDNKWIDLVTWENTTMGTGVHTCDNGGNWATWCALSIHLQPNTANNIVITARDNDGNETVANLTVTHDITNPTVTITSPTTEDHCSPEVTSLTIGGTATDANTIASVSWSNSGTSETGECTLTTSDTGATWSASGIALAKGENANVITVTATDCAGNTATDTLTVTHYGTFAGFHIYPSEVGLIEGGVQEFRVVPVDTEGYERPLPEGAIPVWSATAGEINAGEYTAGTESAVVSLTAAGQTSQVDVEVFPYNVNGLSDDELTNAGYVLERWWGGDLSGPTDITYDASDESVCIADCDNSRMQKYSTTGCYDNTFTGLGSPDFDHPAGVAVDSEGNFYVSDSINNRIQKYSSDWQFISSWGTSGSGNGQFSYPQGITVDCNDNIYVADKRNNRIQKFDSDGNYIAQLSSSTTTGADFNLPMDVAVYYDSSTGKTFVYVADFNNNMVKKFSEETLNQNVFYQKLTSWGGTGTGDGQFSRLAGIDVDILGNVYVSDSNNNRIQKFQADGTFLGKWGTSGTVGGSFATPIGIGHDSECNIYIVDKNNNRVQKYVPAQVSTLTITSPTTQSTYWTQNSTITISGTSTGLISSITWSNDTTGETGKCVGIRDWTAENIPLSAGLNSIVITGISPAGSNDEVTLDVYYGVEDHTISIATPTLTPSTVESGGSTVVKVTAVDSQDHSIIYTWSDGGKGGSFDDVHAATTTYVAPTNTSDSDLQVSITCRVVCQENSDIYNSATSLLFVVGEHKVTLTMVPTLDKTIVSPGEKVECSVQATDSIGHLLTYKWTDGGAGGTFSPSSSTQNPSYYAPKNTTGANLNVTLTCTAKCRVNQNIYISGSAVLAVNDPAPTIAITGPLFTVTGTSKTTNRTGATITLSGTASADTKIITWLNGATGEFGSIMGAESWTIEDIGLETKTNPITVMALDLANNSASDLLQVIRTKIPDDDRWEGKCMVALPIIPDDTDPAKVVDFLDSCWLAYPNQLWKWYPSSYTWLSPANETPGKGFWAKFDSIASEPCGTIPNESSVTIHLYKGWNIIGQPFMKETTWSITKFKVKASPTATEMELKDASTYVKSYAWGWHQNEDDPYTGEYYLVGDSSLAGATQTWKPWRGYWIRALQECYLVIPAPVDDVPSPPAF